MKSNIYTAQHKKYRKELRAFLKETVVPHVEEWEDAGIIPKEVWLKMGEQGFLCPTVSTEYGGKGGDFLYSAILAEEISRTNQWGLTANHHSDVTALYLEKYASEEAKQKFIPKCISGELLTGMAVTEPDAGSDLFQIKTTATEEGDEIVINGSKIFISNGACSDLIVVAARDTSVKSEEFTYSLFLVPTDAPGFDRGNPIKKLGWRSQDTSELYFTNCRIPKSYRLGKAGNGMNMFVENIQSERLIMAIMAVASAEHLLETTLAHCKQEAISQSAQFELVEMSTEVEVGKRFIDSLVADHLKGIGAMTEISMAKCWTTDMVNKLSARCMRLFGHEAMYENNAISRGLRDSRVLKIAGGSNETIKATIADLIGINQPIAAKADLREAIEYWETKLAGASLMMELPTDHPRFVNQLPRYNSYNFTLDQELLKGLRQTAELSKTTLPTTVSSTLIALLARYSQQKEIVIGVPDQENSLVLKAALSETQTFSDLLQQVRLETEEMAQHGGLSFSELSDQMKKAGQSSSLQVLFGTDRDLIEKEEKFELALIVQESEEGLQCEIKYNMRLFEKETISRMAGHIETLAGGFIEAPENSIYEAQILTKEEERQLLVAWNLTEVPLSNKCMHQIFEEQVALDPEHIALAMDDQQMSYGELNIKANQLAHYLLQFDVGPEVPVGICMDRSFDMIIMILAVWKAGGAYIPLEPTFPEERLNHVLSDSQISLLLTIDRFLEKIPIRDNLRTICIDQDRFAIERQKTENPVTEVHQENLSYMIYTSGTTGKPNGSQLSHKGLCNLAVEQSRLFRVTRQSRVLQFAAFSFDASVSEIVMAFCVGGRVVLGRKDSLTPGKPLAETLREQQVSHITISPSALAVQPYEEFPDLKSIIVAAESCPPDLAEQWQKGRNFFNAYGPSECTVCATATRIEDGQRLSIGMPIGNTQVHVLDGNRQLVPIGVPGELYIGGTGVGRGYLNKPELTAKKFIENPFDGDPNGRLFKTADLVRRLPDGNLEFLGRLDHQVKVRGFRIEIGEIESVLSAHRDVALATVLLREDRPTEKRLVAYIILREGIKQDADELREYLRTKLPDYMLPDHIVYPNTIPRGTTGKIDRKALPAPEDMVENSSVAEEKPRTDTEQSLVTLIGSLTNRDQVDVNGTLTNLGMNSLLAVRLVSRIQEEMGVDLSIGTIFESSTIADLAKMIEEQDRDKVVPQEILPAIQRRRPRGRVGI